MQATQTFTNCGLPGVSQIPYGTHMCHFYRDREELVAALVPFFVAGLRRHSCALTQPDEGWQVLTGFGY